MVFYDTINAIDIPLAFGTLVALPNFSFVANKKAVTARSGVILVLAYYLDITQSMCDRIYYFAGKLETALFASIGFRRCRSN